MLNDPPCRVRKRLMLGWVFLRSVVNLLKIESFGGFSGCKAEREGFEKGANCKPFLSMA
jgi:hypothetical protein